jgi:hypothetical protein
MKAAHTEQQTRKTFLLGTRKHHTLADSVPSVHITFCSNLLTTQRKLYLYKQIEPEKSRFFSVQNIAKTKTHQLKHELLEGTCGTTCQTGSIESLTYGSGPTC